MSINLISGNILNANLVRGSNLAISSSSAGANLMFFDMSTGRVGVKTNGPTADFQVNGLVKVGNVTISNVGNVNAGNVNINNLANPVANQDAATKFYVDFTSGNIGNIGNLTFSNTTISTNLANGNITFTPTGTALAIINTTTGLVLPVGNTTQRPSPVSTGTVRYNTDTTRIEVYDGAQWDSVVSDVTNQTLLGNGVQTVFTLNRDSTTAAALVIINGIVQLPTTAYSITGNNLTFTQAPGPSDTVDVRFL